MFITRQRSVRRLAVLALFAILAVAAYGFAAANIVPASKAGDGAGAITGYTVTNVNYNLDGVDPGLINSVTFTLDSAPAAGSTITIKLVQAGTTWYPCTAAGTAVSCSTPGATVLAADELRVIAVD